MTTKRKTATEKLREELDELKRVVGPLIPAARKITQEADDRAADLEAMVFATDRLQRTSAPGLTGRAGRRWEKARARALKAVREFSRMSGVDLDYAPEFRGRIIRRLRDERRARKR